MNKKEISLLNKLPEINNYFSFSDIVTISDCILRDGEQQAGVVFTKEDKVKIAKSLDKLGVDEIEAGMPAVSKDDLESVKSIVNEGLDVRITTLCRAVKEDIDISFEAGVKAVSISLPIGDLQRKHKLKWSDKKYLDTCLSITSYAKEMGMYVILSPYDTTRVNLDFLDRFLRTLSHEGTIDRIRVVDTVGAAHPLSMHYLVKRIKQSVNFEIEAHCHDDFGMATANTIAALSAGAEVASVTMNGVGERSGNTALEEVVTSLEFLYGVKTNIDLSRLKKVSQLIEQVSKVYLQPHKSVVGRNSFSHESGMVVAGLLENPFTAEAIDPNAVGQERKIVIGKGSGIAALNYKLNFLNLDPNVVDTKKLLERVKKFSIFKKRALTNNELIDLYKEIC